MAIQAPWSGTVVLGQSLGVVVHAYANVPGRTERIPLEVIAGTVTTDEEREPRYEATLGCRVPELAADVEAIDGRRGATVTIEAGYVLAGGAEDVHHLATLDVVSAVVRQPQRDLALTLAGRELRLQETDATTSFFRPSSASISVVIGELLQAYDPGVARAIPDGLGLIGDGGVTLNVGASPWPLLVDLATRAGHDLWHDADGTWRVTPTPDSIGQPMAYLSTGPRGGITSTEASRSVTDWFNVLTVVYQWEAPDGTPRRYEGTAEITEGPHAVSQVGRRVRVVTLNTVGGSASAVLAARAGLTRAASRGRSLSIEHAQPAWWLRAGHSVQIRHERDITEDAIASRVDLDLPTGTMHVSTRYPDPNNIVTGV